MRILQRIGLRFSLLIIATIPVCYLHAQDDTLDTGSFIINMGITPQTYNNGLRPYGMVYDLVENYQVPVKWVIKPGKTTGDIDFSHNGIDYRGGPFIVPSEYRTTAVDARIAYWQTQGVIGATSVAEIVVPVFMTITTFPRTFIEDGENIVKPYYDNALIPSTAYSEDSASSLDCCSDLFAYPHGSPSYVTHENVHFFLTQCGGFFYSSCSSVSGMESITNPNPPYQQFNFLSTQGLQCYALGQCNAITELHLDAHTDPVIYASNLGDDPVMQFMGEMHQVTPNGNEKWFIPITGSTWNPNAIKLLMTSDGIAGQEGIKMIYGHAYDDPNYGLVMYHGGHRLNPPGGGPNAPTDAHKTAAQRSYFNFLLLTSNKTALDLATLQSFTGYLTGNDTFTVTPSGGSPPYSYEWTANVPGTFSHPLDSSTTFTHDSSVPDSTLIIIQVSVTDGCGRTNFNTFQRDLILTFLPLEEFSVSLQSKQARLHWTASFPEDITFFNVHRRLAVETDFKTIATVEGGPLGHEGPFNYLDPLASIPNGVVYYKIETHFSNGVSEFSHIASVNWEQGDIEWLKVAPNPARNEAIIDVWCDDKNAYTIAWIDMLGKTSFMRNIHEPVDGMNRMRINLSNHGIHAGIYNVVLKTPGKYPIQVKVVVIGQD